MLTRAMMLALGREATKAIANTVIDRRGDVMNEAQIDLLSLVDEGVTAYGLMSLAKKGKDLCQIERADARLSYMLDNFDTGGVNPDHRVRRINKNNNNNNKDDKTEEMPRSSMGAMRPMGGYEVY